METPNPTLELLRIIGSPFSGKGEVPGAVYDKKAALYELAFENRVELLFLKALEDQGRIQGLEAKKEAMEQRAALTRRIAAETSGVLTRAGVDHVVFKSIKPYPATPNDTDVLCLGDEDSYQQGLRALYQAGYVIQAAAPMQTLLYHPLGEGRVGPGKKGGTYYVDFYRGVATDYYEYVNKAALKKYCVVRKIEGIHTVLLDPEPELAIVMFHNVFPEKTFHLEHFYLCLYALRDPGFLRDRFVDFVEQNALTLAVRCNLTLVEALHQAAFDSAPAPVSRLLQRWGREKMTLQELRERRYRTTYIFPATVFWLVFLAKQKDPFSRRSLIRQLIHMSNPLFFWDALKSAWSRTFNKDIYVHQ